MILRRVVKMYGIHDIEHPEITWIERTGYPSYAQYTQPTEINCEYCGEVIEEDDSYIDTYYDYICEDCLLKLHRRGI